MFKCVASLLNSNSTLLTSGAQLQHLVRVFASVLGTKQIKNDTESEIIGMMNYLQKNHPQETGSAVAALPAELAKVLTPITT
jgi:hypothetical protein